MFKESALGIFSDEEYLSEFISVIDQADYDDILIPKLAQFHSSGYDKGSFDDEVETFPWGVLDKSLEDDIKGIVRLIGPGMSSHSWQVIKSSLDSLRHPQGAGPEPALIEPQKSAPKADAISIFPDSNVDQGISDLPNKGEDLELSMEEDDAPNRTSATPAVNISSAEVEIRVSDLGLENEKKGYTRDGLPKILSREMDDFKNYLMADGIHVSEVSGAKANSLSALLGKGQFNYGSISRRLREDDLNRIKSEKLLVSNQREIVDGNHGWAVVYIASVILDDFEAELDAYIVDLSTEDLVTIANDWSSRSDVKRSRRLHYLKEQIDVSPVPSDKYDRFKFLPKEVRAGREGGDFYYDFRENRPENPELFGEFLSDFPFTFGDSRFGALTRELNALQNLFLEELRVIMMIDSDIKASSSGSMPLTLSNKEKELDKIRRGIDETKNILESFKASVAEDNKFSNAKTIDVLEDVEDEAELEPVDIPDFKYSIKRSMIVNQSRFRAKKRLADSSGKSFNIEHLYFANILNDPTLLDYIVEKEVDGAVIPVPDTGKFKKFVSACVLHLERSLMEAAGTGDKMTVLNDFISAIKMLEDRKIEYLGLFDSIKNPANWIRAKEVSIQEEIFRRKALPPLNEDEVITTDYLMSARSKLFAAIFMHSALASKMGSFYFQPIEGETGKSEKSFFEDKIPWKDKFFRSIPNDLNTINDLPSRFRSYVYNLHESRTESLFNRDDRMLWSGGEYESDMHSFQLSAGIPKLKSQFLGTFVRNKTPGYDLVKCPVCFKTKEIEYRISGFKNYKEKIPEYKSKIVTDLYSPLTSNGQIITSEDLSGTKESPRVWEIDGEEYSWNDILSLTHNVDEKISIDGYSKRNEVYRRLKAKLIKRDVPMDSIRFKCPMDDCGIDYTYHNNFESFDEVSVKNMQPGKVRVVSEQVMHDAEVVYDSYSWLDYASFSDFIDKNAKLLGVDTDRMIKIIEDLNAIEIPTDPSTGSKMPDWFSEDRDFAIKHQSIKEMALSYAGEDGTTGDIIREIKDNNLQFRRIRDKEWKEEILNSNFSRVVLDVISGNDGQVVVRRREHTQNPLHDAGGAAFNEVKGLARRPGYKFSKMIFACPCHIHDPGIDAIDKYNTLAFPHAGPAGFNSSADVYRGRPTTKEGGYYDIEFGTFGFLICGTPTSLSSFTRNPDNDNNIRKFIETGKTRAIEFLIESGVDIEDIRVFLEGFSNKEASTSSRRRMMDVENLFKTAMAKIVKQDLIEELGGLSLTCPHGHVFTIKQSWDFGSTHFGCNLNTHTSARGDSDDKLGGNKYNRYLPIIRTKGFENLLNVLNTGSGIGKYRSYMFRKIADADIGDGKYLEWSKARDEGELGTLMLGANHLNPGIGKSKFKDSVVINIPSAADLKEYLLTIESEAYRERLVEMLSELNGDYYLHMKTIMQSSIMDYGREYSVASAIRGKLFIKELIKQNTGVGMGSLRKPGEEGGDQDPLERMHTGKFFDGTASGSVTERETFYASASEVPIGSPDLQDIVSGIAQKEPKLISWVLLYEKIKFEVGKMSHLSEEQKKAEIDSYLRSHGFSPQDAMSGLGFGSTSIDDVMDLKAGAGLLEMLNEKRSINYHIDNIIKSQYNDFVLGLRSFIKIINTYYLDSIHQITYKNNAGREKDRYKSTRYMKSITQGELPHKSIPSADSFSGDVEKIILGLLDDGALQYSRYTDNDSRPEALSSFTSSVSDFIYNSLTGAQADKINLNNIMFDSSYEKEIPVKTTDNIEDIAKKYNVTFQSISEWNKLGRSPEKANSLIGNGKIKSVLIRGKNKSSISDLIKFSIAKAISSLGMSDDFEIDLGTKDGQVTDSLRNYVYGAIEGLEDPEAAAEEMLYSLTSGELLNAPDIQRQVGSYNEDAADVGTSVFSSIASKFENANEEGYYSVVSDSLDLLVNSNILLLKSTESISLPKIVSSLEPHITSSNIINNNFYPDQISFGSYYRDEETYDEAKIITSQITLLAYAIYLAEGLIFVNDNYLKPGSSKYIGIDLGISESLSSIDSIIKIGSYGLDTIIREYEDIPFGIQMGIKDSFRDYMMSSVESLDSYIWSSMSEAFAILNNRMLGGAQSMSLRYTSMAREIMKGRLSEHSDYFEDPIRSIAFERASIVKSVPMSIEDSGYYSPNKSPRAIYTHKQTGPNAGVASSIDDLEDTDNSSGYPVNERIGYDGRRLCVGRIGKPGSFDYRYPPSDGTLEKYKGSVGFTLPFEFGWENPKSMRTRLSKLGNITIPDFKIVVRIDGEGGQSSGLYDITFLFKKSDESSSISDKLRQDLSRSKDILLDIEKKEIELGLASDDNIVDRLTKEISDKRQSYNLLSYTMDTVRAEFERYPPKIFTSVTNRAVQNIDDSGRDAYSGGPSKTMEAVDGLYSIPSICLIDPYTAYNFIMNPEVSGSRHVLEDEKRALVRFIYDIYNFEPIAEELASRGDIYAEKNDDGSLDIDIENIYRIFDENYYSRYKSRVSKGIEDRARDGHGKYYQIEAVSPSDNSELSYIRYMPLQLSRTKLKKSLDAFRKNLTLSSKSYSSEDFKSLVEMQKIIKSFDKSTKISVALWGSGELVSLNKILVDGWPKQGDADSIAAKFLIDKGVPIVPRGEMSDGGFVSTIKGKCSAKFSSSDYVKLFRSIAADNGVVINEDTPLESPDTLMDIDSYAGYTNVLNEFIGRMIGESNSYFYNSATNRRASEDGRKKEAAVSALESLFKISKLKYGQIGTIIAVPDV